MSTDETPSLPELRALDPDALARLERFGGQKLLHEMIALFLENAPERLAAAEAGVIAGDVLGTENALHSLKSSSAQLGALRLSRICAEGESIAHSGSLSGIAEIVAAGWAELAEVKGWLDGIRDPRPA
jgi:HPt (histidine-containing phosphotransfer) domain-containing protein